MKKIEFLTFNQASLRLRHLTQIIGYNLKISDDLSIASKTLLPTFKERSVLNNGFYFRISIPSNSFFYESELKSSCQAVWDCFSPIEIFPVEMLAYNGILIEILHKNSNGEKSALFSWGIYFSGLKFISYRLPSHSEFSFNSLVFKILGRYYTSTDCYLKSDVEPIKLYSELSFQSCDVKSSYNVKSLLRLHSNKRYSIKLQRKKYDSAERLESRGMKSTCRKIQLEKQVENAKIKILMLQNQLKIEIEELRSITQEYEDTDSKNQDLGLDLLEKYQRLNKLLVALRAKEAKLTEDTKGLKENVLKVRERRCHLLSQLSFVFPIKKISETGEYSIRSFLLPNAEKYPTSHDTSISVTVSLALATQLVIKIAAFTNLPLKYPIIFSGSQSLIVDLVSSQFNDDSRKFPLYTRGKDREKLHFDYALFLFNKNIAQLRWNCGLYTSDLRTTLLNIVTFLSSLCDNSISLPRALMPDTHMRSVILPISLRHTIKTPENLCHVEPPDSEIHVKKIGGAQDRLYLDGLPRSFSDLEPEDIAREKIIQIENINNDSLSDLERSRSNLTREKGKKLQNNFVEKESRPDQLLLKNSTQLTCKLRINSLSLDNGLDEIDGSKIHDQESLNTNISNSINPSSSFPNLLSPSGNEKCVKGDDETESSSFQINEAVNFLSLWSKDCSLIYENGNNSGNGNSGGNRSSTEEITIGIASSDSDCNKKSKILKKVKLKKSEEFDSDSKRNLGSKTTNVNIEYRSLNSDKISETCGKNIPKSNNSECNFDKSSNCGPVNLNPNAKSDQSWDLNLSQLSDPLDQSMNSTLNCLNTSKQAYLDKSSNNSNIERKPKNTKSSTNDSNTGAEPKKDQYHDQETEPKKGSSIGTEPKKGSSIGTEPKKGSSIETGPKNDSKFTPELLKEIGIDDEVFFDDVALRTNNLASQNCTFKLSF